MAAWNLIQDGVAACGHDMATLHPWVLQLLSMWSRGAVTAYEMLYGIGLPNSDYIGLGTCLVNYVASTPA